MAREQMPQTGNQQQFDYNVGLLLVQSSYQLPVCRLVFLGFAGFSTISKTC